MKNILRKSYSDKIYCKDLNFLRKAERNKLKFYHKTLNFYYRIIKQSMPKLDSEFLIQVSKNVEITNKIKNHIFDLIEYYYISDSNNFDVDLNDVKAKFLDIVDKEMVRIFCEAKTLKNGNIIEYSKDDLITLYNKYEMDENQFSDCILNYYGETKKISSKIIVFSDYLKKVK